MKFKGYHDLCKGLEGLPSTWYPDLIRRLGETAYKKGCFRHSGASIFIDRIERKIGYSQETKKGSEDCLHGNCNNPRRPGSLYCSECHGPLAHFGVPLDTA